MLGYPQDGPFDAQPVRIRGDQRLRSPDIYGNGTVTRQVFSLRGLIRPGNSGGPIVSTAGRVLGVVFAASVSDRDTGYALTADQVRRAAAVGLQRRATRCPAATARPEPARRRSCRLSWRLNAAWICLRLLDRALGSLDLLDLADADEAEQGGDQHVDAEHDQEAPGRSSAGQVDEVGERAPRA